jgi:hypothetical protein
MDFSRVLGYLKNFDTARTWQALQDLNVGELIHNPWFLGSIGVLALVSLIMRWRLLLVVLVSVTAFTWLLSYVHQRGTELDGLANDTLLIFAGGGVFIIFFFIYLLFIRGD